MYNFVQITLKPLAACCICVICDAKIPIIRRAAGLRFDAVLQGKKSSNR
jgi:hypothetical protein